MTSSYRVSSSIIFSNTVVDVVMCFEQNFRQLLIFLQLFFIYKKHTSTNRLPSIPPYQTPTLPHTTLNTTITTITTTTNTLTTLNTTITTTTNNFTTLNPSPFHPNPSKINILNYNIPLTTLSVNSTTPHPIKDF